MTQNETQYDDQAAADRPTPAYLVALAWLLVAIPLLYGLWQTLVKAGQLLGG
jgi:hypothetical protein